MAGPPKSVNWFNISSAPMPASREELFACWTDSVKLAAITGKAAAGAAAVGQERSIWGGFARSRVVELDPPLRMVEQWRSKDFPKGAKDAILETEFLGEDGAAVVHLVMRSEFAPGALGYSTMMWWHSKMLTAFRVHFTERTQAPAKAPPRGEDRDALIAWLGPKRTPAQWATHLEALASSKKSRGWWRSRLPVQKGLEIWVKSMKTWGEPALVRAALGAAKACAPVWDEAARVRPDGFDDVVAGFAREGGAPPAEIIRAVEQWLAEPSLKSRTTAEGTLDPTAQLRFTERDLGDLFDKRWLSSRASIPEAKSSSTGS